MICPLKQAAVVGAAYDPELPHVGEYVARVFGSMAEATECHYDECAWWDGDRCGVTLAPIHRSTS
jgi:hypothetical protein